MVAVNFTNDMAERINAEAKANDLTPSEYVSSLMLRDYQTIDNVMILENLSPETIEIIRHNARRFNLSPSEYVAHTITNVMECIGKLSADIDTKAKSKRRQRK